MTDPDASDPATAELHRRLRNVVDSTSEEFRITVSTAIGVLEMLKLELFRETDDDGEAY